MNTPKPEVSWLESFPPDIWAYFAPFLAGEQLGRLMMTGATLLWQRLRSPHVVKSIKLGQDFIVFKSLPQFLHSFFSLEELSIYSPTSNWSNGMSQIFDSIPSGVRILELSGDWNISLFGESNVTPSFSQSVGRLKKLNVRDLYIPNHSWLVHASSLTDLRIRHWDGRVELPPSLTYFEALSVNLSTDSWVAKLPPELESFMVISKLGGVELLLPLLPRSTRQLSLGHARNYSDVPLSAQNLLGQIPQSVTRFILPNFFQIDFATHLEWVALLPLALTELDLEPDLPCTAWPLLPQTLTKLSLQASMSGFTIVSNIADPRGIEAQVKTIPVELLPRALKSLRFMCFSSNSLYFRCVPPTSTQSCFPPRLTELLMSTIHLAPETAKLLPSSLTTLEIASLCQQVCQHLPTGLQRLLSPRTLMSPHLIDLLPKSLTLLQLGMIASDAYWIDYKTGEMISNVSKLPESSIHKECLSNKFDWKSSSLLPSKLIHLELMDVKELGDSFMYHQLLPNLLELTLDSKHFTNLSIPLLPPHLQTLHLPYSSKISGESFKFLPRSLTDLDLEYSESIVDLDIQHLPRTLIHVDFSRAKQLSDLCIPDLPPLLQSLVMRFNEHISPSSFPHLPCLLRSSQLSNTVIFAIWMIDRGTVRHR